MKGGSLKALSLPRKFVFLGPWVSKSGNLGCSGNFAGMSWTPGGVQKACATEIPATPHNEGPDITPGTDGSI